MNRRKTGLLATKLAVAIAFSSTLLFTVFGAAMAAKKVTITFWGWPEQDKHIEAALPGFYKLYPDIEVELNMMPFGDVHQKLVVGLASGSVPDVSMVEISRIAQIRESNALTNLLAPQFGAGRHRNDFVPYKWEQATAPNGALIAIPIDIGPAALFYRRTAFDRAGLPSDPERLIEQLSTWDAYREFGKKLTIDVNGDGKPDQYIIGDAGQVWNITREQTGQPMIASSGAVSIDSTAWLRALAVAVDLRQLGYDAQKVIEWTWSDKWAKGLDSGLLVTEMMGSWFGGFLQKSYSPNTSGEWGVLPLPEKVGVNQGGSFVVIPAASKHKEEAWKFVQYMFATAESQNLMFKILDYFPAYMPAWKDPLYDEPVPYYGGEPVRRIYREVALRTPAVTVHPLGERAGGILGNYVGKAFSGQMAPRAALEAAAREVRALVAAGK